MATAEKKVSAGATPWTAAEFKDMVERIPGVGEGENTWEWDTWHKIHTPGYPGYQGPRYEVPIAKETRDAQIEAAKKAIADREAEIKQLEALPVTTPEAQAKADADKAPEAPSAPVEAAPTTTEKSK